MFGFDEPICSPSRAERGGSAGHVDGCQLRPILGCDAHGEHQVMGQEWMQGLTVEYLSNGGGVDNSRPALDCADSRLCFRLLRHGVRTQVIHSGPPRLSACGVGFCRWLAGRGAIQRSKEVDVSDRYICTREAPWTPDKGRSCHPDAVEEGEQKDGWPSGDVQGFRCPNCNLYFEVELPQ